MSSTMSSFTSQQSLAKHSSSSCLAFLQGDSFSGMKNFLHLNKLIAVWIFTFSIFKNPKAAHQREIHLKKNQCRHNTTITFKNSSSSCLAFRQEDSIGCTFVQLNTKNSSAGKTSWKAPVCSASALPPPKN